MKFYRLYYVMVTFRGTVYCPDPEASMHIDLSIKSVLQRNLAKSLCKQFSAASRYSYIRQKYYKYSFFPLAIAQWNALPETVACLPDLDSFKVSVSKLQHSRP